MKIFKLNDTEDLINVADPLIVSESSTHSITFYEQMIFDAVDKTTKKATLENITSYPGLGNKGINSTYSTTSFTKKITQI